MNLPLVLRRAAQAEFDEAADRYEQQQANLGREFVTKVQVTLDRIQKTPRHFPVVFEKVRQAIVDRFPYSVFFQAEPKRIVILSSTRSKSLEASSAITHVKRHGFNFTAPSPSSVP